MYYNHEEELQSAGVCMLCCSRLNNKYKHVELMCVKHTNVYVTLCVFSLFAIRRF